LLPQLLHKLVSLSSFYPLSVAITQGGAIQLANNCTDGVQGIQTLTMSNAAAGAQPGTTILQYAQTSDGQQILVPSNQVVVQGERGVSKGLCDLWRFDLCFYDACHQEIWVFFSSANRSLKMRHLLSRLR